VTEKIEAAKRMSIGAIMGELFRPERHETIRNFGLMFVGRDVETGYLLARWDRGGELLRAPRPAANAAGKPKETQR
jgi:hypothetical protein